MYATDIGDRENATAMDVPMSMRVRCSRRQSEGQERVVVDLPGKDTGVAGSLSGGRGTGCRIEATQRGVDQHPEVWERPRAMTSARRSATSPVPGRQVSAI